MSRSPLLSYIFTALVLLQPYGFVAIQHQLILTNTTSVADPDLGNISVTLKDSKLSFCCYTFHTITNGIITAELNVKYTEFGSYSNFFKKSINFCELMVNPNLDTLIYLAFKTVSLDQRNHVFSKCPIKAVIFKFIIQKYFSNYNMLTYVLTAGLLLHARFYA